MFLKIHHGISIVVRGDLKVIQKIHDTTTVPRRQETWPAIPAHNVPHSFVWLFKEELGTESTHVMVFRDESRSFSIRVDTTIYLRYRVLFLWVLELSSIGTELIL